MDHREYTYGADLLRDRIIMVTGASDGIGREIAVHAASHGARVVLHGRNVAKLEAVYAAYLQRDDVKHDHIAIPAWSLIKADSDFADYFPKRPAQAATVLRSRPHLRRLARPEEVAQAILYLAGRRSDYVTGQTLSVSGGLTMA